MGPDARYRQGLIYPRCVRSTANRIKFGRCVRTEPSIFGTPSRLALTSLSLAYAPGPSLGAGAPGGRGIGWPGRRTVSMSSAPLSKVALVRNFGSINQGPLASVWPTPPLSPKFAATKFSGLHPFLFSILLPMALSLARTLSRGMCAPPPAHSQYSPIASRFPSLGPQKCACPIQHASNEPDNDRGWNCIMEEERGRVLLCRRRSPRNCSFCRLALFLTRRLTRVIAGNRQGYN